MAAVADRDAGLAGRDDLALLEDPARAVQDGDADPGRIVDGAAPHGGPGRSPYLDTGGGPRHDPQVRELGGAVLHQQGRGGGVLPLDVQILDDRGGAHRQRYAVGRRDPHGADRAFGAAQGHRAVQDEVLPVGPGRDGEDVTVGRRFQGRGEGGVLARAAAPSRCSGVRHLDRALCHGVALPPPRAVRCLGSVRPPVKKRRTRSDHRSAREGRQLTTRGAGVRLPVPGRAPPPGVRATGTLPAVADAVYGGVRPRRVRPLSAACSGPAPVRARRRPLLVQERVPPSHQARDGQPPARLHGPRGEQERTETAEQCVRAGRAR